MKTPLFELGDEVKLKEENLTGKVVHIGSGSGSGVKLSGYKGLVHIPRGWYAISFDSKEKIKVAPGEDLEKLEE